MENDEKIIEERKQKIVSFFKNNPIWIFYIILIGLVIFGISIRTIPMTDHGGHPGLWDITTNDWTLGPDLDPFLFLRYAKEMILNGGLPTLDTMRSVPLGFNPTDELQMVSNMIVLTHKVLGFFGNNDINYAGVVMPVIFFAFTIIAFFLLVREIFYRKDDKETHMKSGIIASIATLFMIIIPVFLPRTIAGIPEKESIGFFFMFAAFYFFLKAWKSKDMKYAIIHGILSGIFSGLMSLSWGGSTYLYFTMSVSCFVAFILNKFNKQRAIAFIIWLVLSPILLFMFSTRYSISSFLFGLDTSLAMVTFIALIVDYIIWNTKIKDNKFLNKLNLPKHITSLIITIILGLVAVIIFMGPSFIFTSVNTIKDMMFNPVTGRWKTTVAENRSPFFNDWGGSFGPMVKNIPVMFWLFFAGSVLLFKKMLVKLEKGKAWALTGLYVLFFLGLVFSRYSSTSLMNGENAISKAFYYLSALALIAGFVCLYAKDYKEGTNAFSSIDYEYLMLFVLLVLCLFTARAAIRLVMVLGPIAPIFMAYLIVEMIYAFRKMTDKTIKAVMIFLIILVLILSIFTFISFYKEIKSEAYNSVPYSYTQQWQKAMAWVRTNTPVNAVFAHWWDYGYWVQSIGNRATVTDGGNIIVYWNYLTGRYVLTGDNQKDALEFLYSHNATHLLIDSSDLGKYGAFSQIGSDKNFDRLSYGPVTMLSDIKQMQETSNGTIRAYQGNAIVEEDINYKDNNTQVFIPGFTVGDTGISGYNAGVVGLLVETENVGNLSEFKQPSAVYYYQGKQIKLPLRYLYYEGKFIDYGTGIEAAIYIIPRVSSSATGGLQVDNGGAAIYISPRILRGLLGQLYLLNDPFNKFSAFKLVHTENSIIVDSLLSQKANIAEWTYFDNYGGLQGPIKIWKINYLGNEKVNPDYLRLTQPASITWQF